MIINKTKANGGMDIQKEQNLNLYKDIKVFLTEFFPVFNIKGTFENYKRNGKGHNMAEFIGIRFTDDIYYLLSRGIIDPPILETISNQ